MAEPERASEVVSIDPSTTPAHGEAPAAPSELELCRTSVTPGPNMAARVTRGGPRAVLALQRAAGNAAVAQLMGAGRSSPRTTVARQVPVAGQPPVSPELLQPFSLARPKRVRQTQTWTCWAAALESWLDATPGRAKLTQRQLIDLHANDPGRPGGLVPSADNGNVWRRDIADAYDMEWRVVRGRELGAAAINQRLRTRGHVVLIYTLGGSAAHANVVYGIAYPRPPRLPVLQVMEPATGTYRERTIEDYRETEAVLVAWPKQARRR